MKKKLLGFLCGIFLVFSLLFVPLGCGAPTYAGIRVTAAVVNLQRTNNPFLATGADSALILMCVYEPLVTVRDDGSVVPRLAKSWEWDEATVTMTIHLDERAKWSDGSAVTADDVKYTYDMHYEHDFDPGAYSSPFVESVTVVDSRTIKFKLTEPLAAFMNEMSAVPVVPKAIWENVDDISEEVNLNPVGSGPFLWTEFVDGSHVLLTANRNYWGGPVHFEQLMFRLYGTEEAMLLALRAGEVDMVPSILTYTQIPNLIENPNVTVHLRRESNYYNMLYFNHRFAPLHIKEVRKAVNIAIDKESIIAFSLSGYGSLPQNCPFVPPSEQNPAAAWEGIGKTAQQRIDIANTLLDGIPNMSAKPATPPAGWTRTYNGQPLEYEIQTRPFIADIRAAETIRDNMASIGIKITLKTVEARTMMGMLFTGTDRTRWTMVLFAHGAQPNFNRLVVEFGHDPESSWYNAGAMGWTNDAIQAPMRQSRRTPDETVRANLVQSIQIAFSEEMPLVPLYQTILISAYRTDRFTGWKLESEFDGVGSRTVVASWPNLSSIKPI